MFSSGRNTRHARVTRTTRIVVALVPAWQSRWRCVCSPMISRYIDCEQAAFERNHYRTYLHTNNVISNYHIAYRYVHDTHCIFMDSLNIILYILVLRRLAEHDRKRRTDTGERFPFRTVEDLLA